MRTSEEIITDIRECLRVGKRMTTLTLKDEYFDQAEIYVAELTELMNLPTPAEPASTITLIDSRVAGLEHRLALVETALRSLRDLECHLDTLPQTDEHHVIVTRGQWSCWA